VSKEIRHIPERTGNLIHWLGVLIRRHNGVCTACVNVRSGLTGCGVVFTSS
jgi:hypothetical protein